MAPPLEATQLDRVLGYFAPQWQLRRARARLAAGLLARHYEGAEVGRRTQGWRRSSGDANASHSVSLARLRDVARDLVRNNPHAISALETIVDHAVGRGILPVEKSVNWNAWAYTTDVDADGRCDIVGLTQAVMRTVVEAGEVLVRRRWRKPSDPLALPMQLQVLEPDFLDTGKDQALTNGGRIVHGVEFDPIGRRVAYWLFPQHPGASQLSSRIAFAASYRVPAVDVLHIFKAGRPGLVRAPTWFAPVLLRFKDFDEYEDATLVKQKIAACLAVLTTDTSGNNEALGTGDDTVTPAIDELYPGMVKALQPGQDIQIVQPPQVREYSDYVSTTLRSIATGIGVTYEDLTGDYTNLPFSAARMSRIRHWARVEGWRNRMLIPQFLQPVWRWHTEAEAIFGRTVTPVTDWTAPALPMIDPQAEGLGVMRQVRGGVKTFSEAIRERGYVVDEFLREYAEDLKRLDELGITLDSDARKVSQAGLTQARPPGTELPDTTGDGGAAADGEDGGDGNADDNERRVTIRPVRIGGGRR